MHCMPPVSVNMRQVCMTVTPASPEYTAKPPHGGLAVSYSNFHFEVLIIMAVLDIYLIAVTWQQVPL